uniref:PARP-type domain-containing protein n=1 Tax=Chromera velia CCMP2878 TaxID=1169474 RepID=A0A0G4HC14_9ALVE|eukprot:Cvel_25947.t1-p1 / transcript=Cvel_25947.t1 / gene=Cvel_25947 / organism=Chromera_velia_CCMP2878 / gene_product=hypothetical protein / transcript_product=hypothetical protein / location=Cvel_scaffold3006:16269-19364(-) / protein_length=431 / sequence_SO=supercontig / SO=protein_coding / is_pseudo=false
MPYIFECEPAKSGRSCCRFCEFPIEKDTLRIGAKADIPEEEAVTGNLHALLATHWYHPNCFPRFRKKQQWYIENMPAASGFSGFHELSQANREMVKQVVRHCKGEAHADDPPLAEPNAKNPSGPFSSGFDSIEEQRMREQRKEESFKQIGAAWEALDKDNHQQQENAWEGAVSSVGPAEGKSEREREKEAYMEEKERRERERRAAREKEKENEIAKEREKEKEQTRAKLLEKIRSKQQPSTTGGPAIGTAMRQSEATTRPPSVAVFTDKKRTLPTPSTEASKRTKVLSPHAHQQQQQHAGQGGGQTAKPIVPTASFYPPGALPGSRLGEIRRAIASLQSHSPPLTVTELKERLSKNHMSLSGSREELLERVAEGTVLGALPSCPRCKKGCLKWHRKLNRWVCEGSADDGGSPVMCMGRLDYAAVVRVPWKK